MTEELGETLTPEESAALSEMESDTAPAPEEKAPEKPAAKAEETPADEAKAEENPEFKSARSEEKPPEGFVPHQAMHAERVKRQELERLVQELQAKVDAVSAPKEETPQYVDPLEDPEGFRRYTDYQQQKLNERLEAITKTGEEERKITQRLARATELESQFAAETADYPQAAQFLHNQRVSELRGMGYGDDEISAQIRKDANGIFDAAEAAGINPAELVYMRAKRAGYAKAEAPQEQQEQSDGERITALAAAQKNTQGLGAAGGGAQSGRLTLAQVAEMSEAELAKIPDDELRAIMGG